MMIKRDHQNNRANSFNTIGLMYMHGTILNELIKKFQHHEITPHIVYIIFNLLFSPFINNEM